MVAFFILDDDLLEKYNTFGINSVPILIKNLLANLSEKKKKKKSHGDEATDFHHNKILKVGSHYNCLAVIM